ncbi:Uncharacterised protein [Candidatus Gugararchaeum adminiculabundum]|nr:Uncharacterised protein [Candidatus Gugararchaeum adminiculabundum]
MVPFQLFKSQPANPVPIRDCGNKRLLETVASFERWHGKKIPSEIMVCEAPRSKLHQLSSDFMFEKGEGPLPAKPISLFSRACFFLQGLLFVGAVSYRNVMFLPTCCSFRVYVHELAHSVDYSGKSNFSELCRKQHSEELPPWQAGVVDVLLEGRAFLAEKFARPFSQKLRDFPLEAIEDIVPTVAILLLFSHLSNFPVLPIFVIGVPVYFFADFLDSYIAPSQYRVGKNFMHTLLKSVKDSKKIMEITAEHLPKSYLEVCKPNEYIKRLREQGVI